MSVPMEDANLMLNGGRPEGCTCKMASDVLHSGYSAPEPAAWTIDPACPRHRDEPAS